MGYSKAPKKSIDNSGNPNPFKAGKVYDSAKTDLALTPPEKDWTVDQLTARLNKHADAVESATASARESSIPNDTDKPADLASFGFNEKTSK